MGTLPFSGDRDAGQRKMEGDKSRTIQEEKLLCAAEDLKLMQRFTFNKDDAAKHPARDTWVRSANFHVLGWSSQSLGNLGFGG